jgi:hypothetical protein
MPANVHIPNNSPGVPSMNLRQLFPILMSFMLFQQSGFGADPELEWSLFRGTMG